MGARLELGRRAWLPRALAGGHDERGGARPPTDRTPPDDDRCIRACRVLLGACDGTRAVLGEDLDDCNEECRADLTPAEASCLAGLACDDPTDGCFE